MTEESVHPIFFELDSPPNEGFIKVKKPSLLVFPAGCQGDSSLLCIDSYNALIDGGSLEKPTFWRLIRHHLSLDCVISTTATSGSLVGINKFLERKLQERDLKLPVDCNSKEYKKLLQHLISPDLGAYFTNYQLSIANENTKKDEDLCAIKENIRLIEELNLKVRSLALLDPIILFMKFDVGKLVMYPLLPEKSETRKSFSKLKTDQEVKSEKQTNKSNRSVGCLLVWFPANPKEKIVRILFPGNSSQEDVLETLDKLENVEFIRNSEITQEELEQKEKKMKVKIDYLNKKPKKTAETKPQTSSVRKTAVVNVNKNNTTSVRSSRHDKRHVSGSTVINSSLITTKTKYPTTKKNTKTSSEKRTKILGAINETKPKSFAARRPNSAIVTKKPTKNPTLTNRPLSAKTSTTKTIKKSQLRSLEATRSLCDSKTSVKKSIQKSNLNLKHKMSSNKKINLATSKTTSTVAIHNNKKSQKVKTSTTKTVEIKCNKGKENKKADSKSKINVLDNKEKTDIISTEPNEKTEKTFVTTSSELEKIKRGGFDENRNKSMNINGENYQDCKDEVGKMDTENLINFEENDKNKLEKKSNVLESNQSAVEREIKTKGSDLQTNDVFQSDSDCLKKQENNSEVFLKLNPLSEPFVPSQIESKKTSSVTGNSENFEVQTHKQLTFKTDTSNDIEKHTAQQQPLRDSINDNEKNIVQTEDQKNVPDVTNTTENCLQILEDGNQQKNLNEINLHNFVEDQPEDSVSKKKTHHESLSATSCLEQNINTDLNNLQNQKQSNQQLHQQSKPQRDSINDKSENIRQMEDQINVPDVTSTAENCLQILEDGNQQKNLNEINLCKLVEDQPEDSVSKKNVTSCPEQNTNTDLKNLQNQKQSNQQLHRQSQVFDEEKVDFQSVEDFVFGTNKVTLPDNENFACVDKNKNSVKESQLLAKTEDEKNGGRNSPIYASIENFNGKLDFDIQPILKFDENMLCSTYLPSSNVHYNCEKMNEFEANMLHDEQSTSELETTSTITKDETELVKDFVLEVNSDNPEEKFTLEPIADDPMMPADLKTFIKNSNNNKEKSNNKRSSDTKMAKPIYVDITYLPHHGNPEYVDELFFKQIRSKYYVLGGVSDDEANTHTLNGLLQGIKSWNDPSCKEDITNVTVIPTRDSSILRSWFNSNYNELENINVQMVSSTCKIFMHNETVEACKIEF